MKYLSKTLLVILAFASTTHSALAVPPPDFLFTIGSQVVQIFSLAVVFLSALFFSIGNFLKIYYLGIKYKKIFWIGTVCGIVFVSLGIALIWQQYSENKAYQDWVWQSKFENQKDQEAQVPEVSRQTTESKMVAPTVMISQETLEGRSFFEENQNLPLAISNKEFQQRLVQNSNYFVLDAREDEEYEIGNFPGSHHIRFADLMAGRWAEVPSDQIVHVFCWSGMRGKEVAEFLRSKKITARYIEKGADGWVSSGGLWSGDIKFTSKYSDSRYQRLFTLAEVKKQIADGTVIVDSREKNKFDRKHIQGSLNIPIIYTPSTEIENALAQIPSGKNIITVCDDFISCFDAKITGVKLEKKGHTFLGRYNKPWEFQTI